MLRSLYAGVSGLRNHQMKMDVIGNDIANINTIGYKGGRINFSEALNQTLATASPSMGTGYVNPMQVGLGMKAVSIQNNFSQGSLENTGVQTDLALEGDGFFVLQGSTGKLYTRAGQFYFNSEGKLVNQRGLAVQGWMINDINSQVGYGPGNLSDVVIDPNMVSDAVASKNVYLSGNLNAGLDTTTEVWTMSSELTEGGANATAASLLNNLDQTTTSLVPGDTIVISGTDSDGTAVNATYTYAAGDTVQQLLDAINSAYSGAQATISDGKIVMTDSTAGDSSTTITLTNGATNTGSVNLPPFENTTAGITGKARTSVVVYDSLGTAHNLVVEFHKTTNDGQWTWEATTGGDETISSGATGTATFDENGALTSFLFDDGVSQITIDPGNGADTMNIQLHAEASDDYAGLSQFDSLSTLTVRDQDGRATGKLIGLTIGPDGMISGTFSNGEIDSIAKLAVATFPNNGGLNDLGDSLYQGSIASGDVQINGLEEGDATSIISGALEMSNVDLSEEFTDMITTQRGFQAAAKVITTSDQILDELLRLKR